MKQVFLAEPVIAHIVAMVGGDGDHRVLQLAAVAQVIEQHAHLVVDLLDQPHIGAKRRVAHIVALEGLADDIARKGGIDRVLVFQLARIADHRNKTVRSVHVVIGRRHDIGPVRLDIGQVAHPRAVAVRRVLFHEADHLAGQPGCLRILFTDIGRLATIAVDPARRDAAVFLDPGVGEIVPGIVSLVPLLAEVGIIG